MKNQKPKFPPNRIIECGNLKNCSSCGSSMKRRYFWDIIHLFSSKGCYQPNCVFYYKGFPTKDYNKNLAFYSYDGKLVYNLDN